MKNASSLPAAPCSISNKKLQKDHMVSCPRHSIHAHARTVPVAYMQPHPPAQGTRKCDCMTSLHRPSTPIERLTTQGLVARADPATTTSICANANDVHYRCSKISMFICLTCIIAMPMHMQIRMQMQTDIWADGHIDKHINL